MKHLAFPLLLSIILVSCGDSSSHKNEQGLNPGCKNSCDSGHTADGNNEKPDDDRPVSGSETGGPKDDEKPDDRPVIDSTTTLPKDTEKPRLVDFQQIGLTQFKFEFSEPIRNSNFYGSSSLFGSAQWSADRKVLIVPFDVKNAQELTLNSYRINSLTDDAGNTLNLNLDFPIDIYAPRISGAQWLDGNTIEVSFDEDVVLKPESVLTINQTTKAQAAALQSVGKKIRFQVEGDALPLTKSYLFRLTFVADVYGNSVDYRTGRSTDSDDKEAPAIIGIEQKTSEVIANVPYAVFHLSYSEYVVDGRDEDKAGGILGELGGLLDSLKSFDLNGQSIFYFEVKWQPDADHKGVTIKLPRFELKHNETNKVTLELTDIAGNKTQASKEFVPDIKSPSLLKNSCRMDGLTAFRCALSDSDVSAAVLEPLASWPQESYTFEVIEEKAGETTQRWLSFKFKTTIAEEFVQSIEIKDAFGNSNRDQYDRTIMFKPSTRAPQITKVNAFGQRLLELTLDRSISEVKSVSLLHAEGSIEPGFTWKQQGLNLLLQFDQDIAAGTYDVKLFGVKSQANPILSGDLMLEKQSNTANAILNTTIKSQNEKELTFELVRPLAGSIKVFSLIPAAQGASTKTLLNDITIVEGPVTERGTFPIRLVKATAEGLRPNSLSQTLVLQLDGEEEGKRFVAAWSTKAPSGLLIRSVTSRTSLEFQTSRALDIPSIDMDVVDAEGNATKVSADWLAIDSKYSQIMTITLPTALKQGSYTLRLKSAQSKNFGIALTEALSAEFEVK